MTAAGVRTTSEREGVSTVRRLTAAARAEVRAAWRYGVVALAAVLAVLWSVMLFVLPSEGGQRLLPLLLVMDTAGFGALIAVGLMLFERVERVDVVRAMTPLRPWETVAARVAVLTALAVVMAVPMTLVAGVPLNLGAVAAVVGGVAMTSVLLIGTCLALGGGAATLPAAFLRIAPGVVLLIVVPALHLTGVVRTPLLYLVPSTAGAELVRVGTAEGASMDACALAAFVWGVAGMVAACAWAARGMVPSVDAPLGRPRSVTRRVPGGSSGSGRTGPGAATAPGRTRSRSPLVSFLRFDLMAGRRDALILLVLFAPAFLALLIRVAYPRVSAFVRDSYGFALASAGPAVFAALVLLHVPMIVGSVIALRFMEDVDDRALLVLRASPLPLRGYIAYRSGAAALLTLVGLAVAVPLSGLAPPMSVELVAAVVVAAAAASLFVLAVTAMSANKVEALVVIKGVSAVSVLLPILAWALPAPLTWVVLVAPPGWALMTLPGLPISGLSPVAAVLGGLVWTAVLCVVAARRTEARQER